MVTLAGHFAIGSSGAISTTATVAQGLDPGALITGATVTKTGGQTGRYTVTFQKTWKRMHACFASIEIQTGNFPTATGSDPQIRTASTASFYIQCKRPDTQADANPASGSVIHWTAIVSD
jgi:hypothetical protein